MWGSDEKKLPAAKMGENDLDLGEGKR